MNNQNAFQAANAYISSQLKHTGETSHKFSSKVPRPFVTISRETGSGGTRVGEKLVEFLNYYDYDKKNNWTLFDKNLIEKVIEEHNLPSGFKYFLNEEKVPELQSVFETLSGMHPGISRLVNKTCSTIAHMAALGNVVIIGRGANILTRHHHDGFHVRLIAESDWKIKQISSRLDISKQEAMKYIQREDLNRKEYVRKYFNKNVADPLLYDLIIRTSSVTFEEAAEIIGRRVMRISQKNREAALHA
jgi:cytidylate kinase